MEAGVLASEFSAGRQHATWWSGLSLSRQYMIASSGVLVASMTILGTLACWIIAAAVTHSVAMSAALYIENVIAPHVRDLTDHLELPAERRAALDNASSMAVSQRGVVAMKIWSTSGTIVYATRPEEVGRRFPIRAGLRSALSGIVHSELENLDDESEAERATGIPLLEIYVPIRNSSGSIIGAAEFYENAITLQRDLAAARATSWLGTSAVTLMMMGALFGIVAKGSRTIEQQRLSLTERIGLLSELLHQNEELRGHVQLGARRAAEDNERFRTRLGSDLHDGPAQVIGFALLRLDSAFERASDRSQEAATAVRLALTEGLREIRNVCSGLIMPEVRDLTLGEAFRYLASAHERRTGTAVAFDADRLPEDVPSFVKICLCRFIQEALTNAYRHAEGKGQSIRAWADDTSIYVQVSDKGPGLKADAPSLHRGRLGLNGLRIRIDGLGGSLEVVGEPGKGTRLTASLPYVAGSHSHGT